MNYSFFFEKKVPQTQPIPGRESEMIQGRSGGYMFAADVWTRLRRCLIIGTAESTYYADKKELTGEFADVVKEAIALDPERVATEIWYASDGHAINNSAPIFALVLLSAAESKEAKKHFKKLFPQVIRTGSHLYEWLGYTRKIRGMGRIIREVAKEWLSQDVKSLAYQLLKYQQRYGFSSRDVLRIFKPVAPSVQHQDLFYWVTKGWTDADLGTVDVHPPELKQIWWFEYLKRNPDKGAIAVREGRLTHEMTTGVANMNKEVWRELFLGMPIGALLRNLGSLTEIGVLRPDAIADLNLVDEKLTNKDLLRKARIHPIDILKALKTYKSGGSLGKSSKTWSPVGRINDILNEALNLSFQTQEPTQKLFLHAIDVSGSMSGAAAKGAADLTCCEIATVMALVTAKAEKNYIIKGFSNQFIDLGIDASDTFFSAMRKAKNHNYGSTDASLAYEWALKEKIVVDMFCCWTDNESFAGRRHPSQALAEYRKKVNPTAKAVYVSMAPYGITQVDPKDPLSYDIAGFDPSTPKYIQMLASGELN